MEEIIEAWTNVLINVNAESINARGKRERQSSVCINGMKMTNDGLCNDTIALR